jgi:branched-chain amino acid transport system permease protein
MQILINGLIQGLLIALTAMGFSVVYRSTGIFHIAQGAVYTLSPYILMAALSAGASIMSASAFSLAIAIMLSMFLEKANHWPLYNKQASMEIHLISSLGFYIVAIQVIAIIWGNETMVLREGIDETYTISNVILTKAQILGGVISLLIIFLFFVWLKRTELGLRFKALADNPIQLSLLGYDIGKLRLLVLGLSGIFTASAALLTAMDIGFDPHGGMSVVLLAMVATIIGGKGSFIGPVIGGVLLGIARSQVVWYTSARWQDAITFILLALFLFFRPQGIMEQKGRVETS